MRVGYVCGVHVERDKCSNKRLKLEKRTKIFHARNISALQTAKYHLQLKKARRIFVMVWNRRAEPENSNACCFQSLWLQRLLFAEIMIQLIVSLY